MYTGKADPTACPFYNTEESVPCPAVYMIPYMPYFDDFEDKSENMMRIPPYAVESLLKGFETQNPQLFTQLERYRVPRFFIRRIFRTIIAYLQREINAAKPLPLPADRYSVILFNRLLTQRPVLARMFTYFGVPARTSENIILALIRFVLDNTNFPPRV